MVRRSVPHGGGPVRRLRAPRRALPAGGPARGPDARPGRPRRIHQDSGDASPAPDPPGPPWLPARLSLLRGRHQHGRVLLLGVRGPHARLLDGRGHRPLLRRPALGARGSLPLGEADRHLGTAVRGDGHARPVVRRGARRLLRDDERPVLRGGHPGRHGPRRRPGRGARLHGEPDPPGPGGGAVRLLLPLREDRGRDGTGHLRDRVAPDGRQPARRHPLGRRHVRRRPRPARARPGGGPGAEVEPEGRRVRTVPAQARIRSPRGS